MASSYLHRLNPARKGGMVHSLVAKGADLLIFAGGSYGLGYLTGRYREKTLIAGRVPLDFGVGVVGSAVSVGLKLWGKDNNGLAPLIDDAGKIGISAWAHTHGVGDGTKKSGTKRLVVPEGDLKKVLAAAPNAVVVGEIASAPTGQFIPADRLSQLARG